MADASDYTSFQRQEGTLKHTAEAIGRTIGKIAVAGMVAGAIADQMGSQTTVLSRVAVGASERISRYLETHSAAGCGVHRHGYATIQAPQYALRKDDDKRQGAVAMEQTAGQIENQISEARRELDNNLRALEQKTKSSMDWREQYHARPAAALACALGAGILLSRFLGGKRWP